jgi:glycosyltransferase involved in cell wall biosynthesis
MHRVDAGRIRILVDLKPAFDGFAGIPQETRLLFRALRGLSMCETAGLVQHGGRHLRAGLRVDERRSVSAQIYQLSKLIVSMNERSSTSRFDAVAEVVRGQFLSLMLRLRTSFGLSVPLSIFRSELFADFVWRTLFEKTLAIADKDAVAGGDYLVLRPSRKALQNISLRTKPTAVPRFPVIDTAGFDYLLAQTPFPGRVSKGTRMIVRYHDAVPLLMPHTIKDKAFHQASHYQALRSNVASGALFACVSEATRRDLLTIFPEAESRARVIHNMVSDEFYLEEKPRAMVSRVIRNRLAESKALDARSPAEKQDPGNFEYMLMVSTLEPRKNHALLLSAWEQLKYSGNPDLKLVVVGNLGWDASATLRAFRPLITRGELFWLQNVPAMELRALYQHAAVTVCPSLAEGFDYSGVEAMRCGCAVASSDIPVHREIYGDASAFFNPYAPRDAAQVLAGLLGSGNAGRRADLVRRGQEVSDRYTPERIASLWVELLSTAHVASPHKP